MTDLFSSSAAETPIIPTRFDVMADYNYTKVSTYMTVQHRLFQTLALTLIALYSPANDRPLIPLFPAGNCRNSSPVCSACPVAAHTQGAASARILLLHVRHLHSLKGRVDQVLRLCLRFSFDPRCLQDDTEEGMRRSNAQHRLDHSEIAVVPQCGTQDPHSVSLSTGMLVS